MKKAAIHRNQPIVAHHQAPEAAQPGKGALDFIPTAVAPELATVLQLWFRSIPPMRANQIDAALPLQALAKRITVVALISDQPRHALTGSTPPQARHLHLVQRGFDQLDFRGRGRSKCASQRNTLAVDHHHPLCSFALLGLADAEPPFFAGAKLPSAKTSSHIRYCCWSSWPSKPRQTSIQMSNSSQSFKRRQQVLGLGYRSGRSRQRAPVLSTQRMPSSTGRLLRHGRPPLLPGFILGSSGSSFSHWSSFKSGAVRAIGSPPTAYYPKSP